MGLIPTPLFFQTLVGFLWLGRDSPVDSPSLKAMDPNNGLPIVLFPGDVETQINIHANVNKSIPVSFISKPVLECLRLSCEPCDAIEVQDQRHQPCRPFGKVLLQWHEVGIAKQHAETFYVIESETKVVILGETASRDISDKVGAGAYPLELGQQTSEQKAEQVRRKAEADKRRAEERKQQEARDREKR
ncbi:MAG: hypothetical protein L6R41_003829 [Letrouitia leprolyta]|nr:MAG: hypothetical protein L6R41_003829 [Letrouitia leprolyta]